MPDASASSAPRRVMVLGSTGSVGVQTLEVIDHLNGLHARGEFPHGLRVVGLAAGRGEDRLREQHRRYPDARLALAENGTDSTPFVGADAAERLVREVPCDLVVSAITGTAGLAPTYAAVELGRDVALANKESLVAAGALIVPLAHRTGARLLPIDSEHAGVWQCLAGLGDEETERRRDGETKPRGPVPPMAAPSPVERVWITASGGALRDCTPEQVYHATPEQALRHPTWSMGPKVTIDSATLMNKSLEIIEAHWLFGLEPDRIGVLIHPQSVVHAMVETSDGGVIAQLAAPDMRGPIHYALAWPDRTQGPARRLNWTELGRLEFGPPRGPCARAIELGHEAIREGGTSGAILNAANEAAVAAFLARRIPLGRIVELTAEATHRVAPSSLRSLADARAAAGEAHRFVETALRA